MSVILNHCCGGDVTLLHKPKKKKRGNEATKKHATSESTAASDPLCFYIRRRSRSQRFSGRRHQRTAVGMPPMIAKREYLHASSSSLPSFREKCLMLR